MASEVRRGLGSCLSEGLYDFATNPKNPTSAKLSKVEFVDKLFRLFDPCFDLSAEIAKSVEAPKETVDGINKGRNFFKLSRDALSLFNIFRGVIAALILGLMCIYRLARDLCTRAQEPTNLTANPRKYNERAFDTKERIAALISQLGKALGSLTYIIGFGVCKPIANYKKYISSDISPNAEKVSGAFAYVMFVNHVGAIIGCFADFFYQTFAHDRVLATEGYHAENYKIYSGKMRDNFIGVAEKTFELGNDVIFLTGHVAPSPVRIIIGFGIGITGVLKEAYKD